MSCREIIQSILELASQARSSFAIVRPAARRTTLTRALPVAEFQYHSGKAMWGELRVGQALTLVREPCHPHDKNAVRVEWRGICRVRFDKFLRQNRPQNGERRTVEAWGLSTDPSSIEGSRKWGWASLCILGAVLR